MNTYFFSKEKNIELIEQIENKMIEKKDNIMKAFSIDKDKWEFLVKFDVLIQIIEQIKNEDYLPCISKEKIVDGLGNILLVVKKQNPYKIFGFILSAIYTNNRVTAVLTEKMLASNKVLIEIIKSVIEDNYPESGIVNYIEIRDYSRIIDKQDDYDLVYFCGNKEEYLNFIKRIHIASRFENFGEIAVYIDSESYKDRLLDLDKYAYDNEFIIEYYKGTLLENMQSMNKTNDISKIAIIYTENTNTAFDFIKMIKCKKVYVNIDLINDFEYSTSLENLVYEKRIILK